MEPRLFQQPVRGHQEWPQAVHLAMLLQDRQRVDCTPRRSVHGPIVLRSKSEGRAVTGPNWERKKRQGIGDQRFAVSALFIVEPLPPIVQSPPPVCKLSGRGVAKRRW